MSKAAYNKLMTHTFTIESRKLDGEGNLVTTENHIGVKGFAEDVTVLTTDKKEEDASKPARIFLRDDAPIKSNLKEARWFITLTAPIQGTECEILRIERIADPRTGILHHYELLAR